MNTPPVRGSVAVDHDRNLFATWAGKNFHLYNLNERTLVHTLKASEPLVYFARHVAFAEDGSRVVGGSDTSKATVYDTETGSVVQDLDYTDKGLVQPVAVRLASLHNFH